MGVVRFKAMDAIGLHSNGPTVAAPMYHVSSPFLTHLDVGIFRATDASGLHGIDLPSLLLCTTSYLPTLMLTGLGLQRQTTPHDTIPALIAPMYHVPPLYSTHLGINRFEDTDAINHNTISNVACPQSTIQQRPWIHFLTCPWSLYEREPVTTDLCPTHTILR